MTRRSDSDWVYPEDSTDVLPEPLRSDTKRRRRLVRVGSVVVAAIVVLLVLLVLSGEFIIRAAMYGEMYEWIRR